MKRVKLKIGMALILSIILASCSTSNDEQADTRIRRLRRVIDQQKATIRSLRRQLEQEAGNESESPRCLAAITEPIQGGGGVE